MSPGETASWLWSCHCKYAPRGSLLSAQKGAHAVSCFWITGPLVVFAGIKDLKLMKTTQSGFEGFFKNEHTTLPERNDRILCGELFCKWSYGECKDLDFDCIWYTSNPIPFTTPSLISKSLCTTQHSGVRARPAVALHQPLLQISVVALSTC